MGNVAAISRSSNQLPNAHKMQPCLSLCVCIFHQLYFGLLNESGNVGQGEKIIDPLAIMLEVKASISKGIRLVDYGLSDLVDLFLRRNLLPPLDIECHRGLVMPTCS